MKFLPKKVLITGRYSSSSVSTSDSTDSSDYPNSSSDDQEDGESDRECSKINLKQKKKKKIKPPLDRNTNTSVHSPRVREQCSNCARLNFSSNHLTNGNNIRVTPPTSLLSDYSVNPNGQCYTVHVPPPVSLLSDYSHKYNIPCQHDLATNCSNPQLSNNDTFYSFPTDKGTDARNVNFSKSCNKESSVDCSNPHLIECKQKDAIMPQPVCDSCSKTQSSECNPANSCDNGSCRPVTTNMWNKPWQMSNGMTPSNGFDCAHNNCTTGRSNNSCNVGYHYSYTPNQRVDMLCQRYLNTPVVPCQTYTPTFRGCCQSTFNPHTGCGGFRPVPHCDPCCDLLAKYGNEHQGDTVKNKKDQQSKGKKDVKAKGKVGGDGGVKGKERKGIKGKAEDSKKASGESFFWDKNKANNLDKKGQTLSKKGSTKLNEPKGKTKREDNKEKLTNSPCSVMTSPCSGYRSALHGCSGYMGCMAPMPCTYAFNPCGPICGIGGGDKVDKTGKKGQTAKKAGSKGKTKTDATKHKQSDDPCSGYTSGASAYTGYLSSPCTDILGEGGGGPKKKGDKKGVPSKTAGTSKSKRSKGKSSGKAKSGERKQNQKDDPCSGYSYTSAHSGYVSSPCESISGPEGNNKSYTVDKKGKKAKTGDKIKSKGPKKEKNTEGGYTSDASCGSLNIDEILKKYGCGEKDSKTDKAEGKTKKGKQDKNAKSRKSDTAKGDKSIPKENNAEKNKKSIAVKSDISVKGKSGKPELEAKKGRAPSVGGNKKASVHTPRAPSVGGNKKASVHTPRAPSVGGNKKASVHTQRQANPTKTQPRASLAKTKPKASPVKTQSRVSFAGGSKKDKSKQQNKKSPIVDKLIPYRNSIKPNKQSVTQRGISISSAGKRSRSEPGRSVKIKLQDNRSSKKRRNIDNDNSQYNKFPIHVPASQIKRGLNNQHDFSMSSNILIRDNEALAITGKNYLSEPEPVKIEIPERSRSLNDITLSSEKSTSSEFNILMSIPCDITLEETNAIMRSVKTIIKDKTSASNNKKKQKTDAHRSRNHTPKRRQTPKVTCLTHNNRAEILDSDNNTQIECDMSADSLIETADDVFQNKSENKNVPPRTQKHPGTYGTYNGDVEGDISDFDDFVTYTHDKPNVTKKGMHQRIKEQRPIVGLTSGRDPWWSTADEKESRREFIRRKKIDRLKDTIRKQKEKESSNYRLKSKNHHNCIMQRKGRDFFNDDTYITSQKNDGKQCINNKSTKTINFTTKDNFKTKSQKKWCTPPHRDRSPNNNNLTRYTFSGIEITEHVESPSNVSIYNENGTRLTVDHSENISNSTRCIRTKSENDNTLIINSTKFTSQSTKLDVNRKIKEHSPIHNDNTVIESERHYLNQSDIQNNEIHDTMRRTAWEDKTTDLSEPRNSENHVSAKQSEQRNGQIFSRNESPPQTTSPNHATNLIDPRQSVHEETIRHENTKEQRQEINQITHKNRRVTTKRKKQSLDDRPKWRCHLNLNNDNKTVKNIQNSNNGKSERIQTHLKIHKKSKGTYNECKNNLYCRSLPKTVSDNAKETITDDHNNFKKISQLYQEEKLNHNNIFESNYTTKMVSPSRKQITLKGTLIENNSHECRSPPKATQKSEETGYVECETDDDTQTHPHDNHANGDDQIVKDSNISPSQRAVSPDRCNPCRESCQELGMPGEFQPFMDSLSPIKAADVNTVYSIDPSNKKLESALDITDLELELNTDKHDLPIDADTGNEFSMNSNLSPVIAPVPRTRTKQKQSFIEFEHETMNITENEQDKTSNNSMDSFSRDSLDTRKSNNVFNNFSLDSLEPVSRRCKNNPVYVKSYHSTKATPVSIKSLECLKHTSSQRPYNASSISYFQHNDSTIIPSNQDSFCSTEPCTEKQDCLINHHKSSTNNPTAPQIINLDKKESTTIRKGTHLIRTSTPGVSCHNHNTFRVDDDDELTSDWLSSEHSGVITSNNTDVNNQRHR